MNCVSVDTQFGIIIIMLVNCVSVDTQFGIIIIIIIMNCVSTDTQFGIIISRFALGPKNVHQPCPSETSHVDSVSQEGSAPIE